MPYEISNSYQMDQSIRFKGCWVVIYTFIQILQEYFVGSSGDPDRTTLSVAVSDLDLHCSSLSHKRRWSSVG